MDVNTLAAALAAVPTPLRIGAAAVGVVIVATLIGGKRASAARRLGLGIALVVVMILGVGSFVADHVPENPGAEAANGNPVGPNTPGPENGSPCAADAHYTNETTDGLLPDVAAAWNQVVTAARTDGVTACLNDGKRSKDQQKAQYRQYVREYGTAVARELVLPPGKSAHVTGTAVDVQPADAYRWLQATAGSLGFCRIYDNEPWHFEYDRDYAKDGCPPRQPQPAR